MSNDCHNCKYRDRQDNDTMDRVCVPCLGNPGLSKWEPRELPARVRKDSILDVPIPGVPSVYGKLPPLVTFKPAPIVDYSATSKARKATPLVTGCLDYFPDALEAVARLSKKANEKHNPGQPLHWSKGKSNDHADCLGRHLKDRGQIDPEFGESHTVAVAWRALALLQTEIENGRDKS